MSVAQIESLCPDDDNKQMLTLVSGDGQLFLLEQKFACISKLLRTAIDSDATADQIPLPSTTSVTLKLIVEYMTHHRGEELPVIEKPLKSTLMKDVCADIWDADFIDKVGDERQILYNLILAANYMDITSLIHLGCAKVASLIKGQPLDKIKDILAVVG